MDEWLQLAAAKLAGAAGDDATSYALADDERGALLDLARIAAHESGDRTNAPLACYLVGLALGRHPELSLTAVVSDTVRES